MNSQNPICINVFKRFNKKGPIQLIHFPIIKEKISRILRYCRQLMAKESGMKKINCQALTCSGSDTKRTYSLIVIDDFLPKVLPMLPVKNLGKITLSIPY